jgi:hypothetical protein
MKIKGDLIRAITPIDMIFDESYKSKWLEKVVRRKDYDKMNKFLENVPKMKSWKADKFAESYHTNARGSYKYGVGSPKKIMTMDVKSWQRYLKELQDRVGYSKAGWAVAVQRLGGSVPAWISKHIPYAKGGIDENVTQPSKDTTNFYVSMWNSTPLVNTYTSRYNYAIGYVADKMSRDISAKLDYLAKKRGLT